MVRGEASGHKGRRFYSREEQYTAFEGGDGWQASNIQLLYAGWGSVGMAGGPVQEEEGGPGGPVQNISDVGGREGAYWKGCLHIGVFTPSLGTREYLPVNNSLDYKTQIKFLQR